MAGRSRWHDSPTRPVRTGLFSTTATIRTQQRQRRQSLPASHDIERASHPRRRVHRRLGAPSSTSGLRTRNLCPGMRGAAGLPESSHSPSELQRDMVLSRARGRGDAMAAAFRRVHNDEVCPQMRKQGKRLRVCEEPGPRWRMAMRDAAPCTHARKSLQHRHCKKRIHLWLCYASTSAPCRAAEGSRSFRKVRYQLLGWAVSVPRDHTWTCHCF